MKYHKRFSLHFNHRYFNNESDTPEELLRFEPILPMETPKPSGKLFLRKEACGFAILDRVEEKGFDESNQNQSSSLSSQSSPSSPVQFIDTAIYPNDTHFHSFSNLDINYKNGEVFYIGNHPETQAQTGEEKQILLTDLNSNTQFTSIKIWLRSKQCIFPIESGSWKQYTLKDRTGFIIKTWHYADNEKAVQLSIDLSQWSAGLYYLQKDEDIIHWFYVSDALMNKEERPAIIAGIGLESIDTGEEASKSPVVGNFTVEIFSRTVFWHFHVLVRSNHRDLSQLAIVNKNKKQLKDIQFNQEQINEMLKEVVFTGNTAIPLSEEGFKDLELVETPTPNVPLIPHLPNADITSLHMENNQWISKIYVNI